MCANLGFGDRETSRGALISLPRSCCSCRAACFPFESYFALASYRRKYRGVITRDISHFTRREPSRHSRRKREREKARSENVTVICKKSRPTRCTKNSRSEISAPRRLARTYFFARQRDAAESISGLRFFLPRLCFFL